MKKRSIVQTGWGIMLLASLCNILWGSAIPFINLGYRSFAVDSADTATQILFAGIRFTLAGLITILIRSLMLRRPAIPKKGGLHRVAALALTQTMLQYFMFYVGVAHTEAVKSSIIQGLNSFVAILVACYLFRTERMTLRKAVGGLLGIAGVLTVQLNGGSISSRISLAGEGALVMSMLAGAVSSSLIKRFGQEDDPMTLSGWQFTAGGIVMAAAGFIAGGRLVPVSPLAVPTLLYLALLSATAYSLWSVLLSSNPVSRIAAYMVLQPIFGVFLTMILTGGSNGLSPARIVIALILVSACIMLITLDNEKNPDKS
ncbi:MAG: DMT family transporter [Clostridia bacterium]|nr:DMT family transporter [Clostridia bacterium]